MNKQQRLNALVAEMYKRSMTMQEAADFLHKDVRFIYKYIAELRFNEEIYVAFYDINHVGKPRPNFRAGSQPDQEIPDINNNAKNVQKYRDKIKTELSSKKFTPRMDVAAAWMRNPIC